MQCLLTTYHSTANSIIVQGGSPPTVSLANKTFYCKKYTKLDFPDLLCTNCLDGFKKVIILNYNECSINEVDTFV